MSETDSFIREVTEEVQQDQMLALWKKWGPFIIGGIAIVVGAAAWWSWSQSKATAAAEARGAIFIAADNETLEDQLALPGQIDGPAAVLAELAAAGALARDGRGNEAASAYQAIAGKAEVAQEYRDLAALQFARIAGGAEGIAALDPLLGEDRAFRVLALELRGALHLGQGDTDAAHADWQAVMTDPVATPGARQRAAAALAATGGEIPDQSG